MDDATRKAGVAALRRAFGDVDEDVLAAVLEMHNGDSRAATNFLQAGNDDTPAYDANQLNRMAEADGVAPDYPLPTGGAAAVLKTMRARQTANASSAGGIKSALRAVLTGSGGRADVASNAGAKAAALKRLFVGAGSEDAMVGEHFTAQREAYREYLAVLFLLLRGNVDLTKSARPRILAAAWARGDRNLPNRLLLEHADVFQLPHILEALQLLDSARQVRALEKRLRRLEAHNAQRAAAKQAQIDEFRRRAREGTGANAAAAGKVAAALDKTAKTKVTTILKLKKDIAELQRESSTLAEAAGGASRVGGVSGALQRHIQRWARTLDADQLVYLSLSMPPEPWQELADLVHLSPKRDFAVDWFLPRAFGTPAPDDSPVAVAERIVSGQIERDVASGKLTGTIGDNYARLCEEHKVPYNFLRMHVKPIPGPLKVAVARYTAIDTCVWFHEEIASDSGDPSVGRRVNAILAARMQGKPIPGASGADSGAELKPELPQFGYGKLMERLLYFLTVEDGGELAEALIPLADSRLANISRELKLEAPVVVLGDASYSMDVAIRTATVIGSVIAAAAKADLKFFTDKSVSPKIVPKTARQVLDVAASVNADGQTAPAAALWPYFEQKKVVRCFVVVTDEIENDKYRAPNGQQFWFPDLFAKYHAEVFPAQLVFVSFLDDPSDANKLGRMVAACEHLGCPPTLTFKLDARRPDLQKLDTILGMLQAETASFPRLVQRLAGRSGGAADGKAEADDRSEAATNTRDLDEILAGFGSLRISSEDVFVNPDNNAGGKTEDDVVVVDDTLSGSSDAGEKPFCVICEENPSDTVLLNCGHAMFCAKCADEAIMQTADKQCPVCRQKVERTLRIFQ